jgi:uncharacterized protein YjiK
MCLDLADARCETDLCAWSEQAANHHICHSTNFLMIQYLCVAILFKPFDVNYGVISYINQNWNSDHSRIKMMVGEMRNIKNIILTLVIMIGIVCVFSLSESSIGRAQTGPAFIRQMPNTPAANIELSLTNPQSLQIILSRSELINTFDTSQFDPASPDPSGITFIPPSNTLLISDSEVNETAIFEGVNLFEVTLSGSLVNTFSTISFSNEPTGLDYNPDNGHLFYSDDNADRIFEAAPGDDGILNTHDDIITSFDTTLFGSHDPEGVAYDSWNGRLFIADGVNGALYQLIPGVNGVYDGVPPEGDDQVVHFDTSELGLVDIEDVAFNIDNGHLNIISRGLSKNIMIEATTAGELINAIDISAANAIHPDGITFAPSNLDPAKKSVYIADRGIDNDSDPNENDGKIYEMSLPAITEGNHTPEVSTTPDQRIKFGEVVTLGGTVSDDGIPDPPGAVDTFWAKVKGPGEVFFDSVTNLNTTATFSRTGIYVLRLFASDGELTKFDDMTVTVYGEFFLPLISK